MNSKDDDDNDDDDLILNVDMFSYYLNFFLVLIVKRLTLNSLILILEVVPVPSTSI